MNAVNNRSECDANGGFYKHGHCYHECPYSKFLINDECHDIRSTQYSQSDCEAVGGHYNQSYCYLKGCNFTMVNNKCYKRKTSDYSNKTCINIGGYYAAESAYPSHYYCYYTIFNCRGYAVNGQCYSRSSTHSHDMCKTIPDSYYDPNNGTCYYYCTQVPALGRCFAANDSSFTENTCENINGVYFSGTCYYVTSHCSAFKTSDGQCYSNRSAEYSCSTCKNIGGHYQDGFCYYAYSTDNCRKYSIDGQCYTNRSSGYSSSSCTNIGGLIDAHSHYCYYEASKCRWARYYRNCTCFERYSSDKTADTCVNIGGYYDFNIQGCYYNWSSSCPYYSVNSQCYRYRNPHYSRNTCSNIAGYYDYVCYFNEFSCNNWANDQCYSSFNASFNEGTCASIGGYYSQNPLGCYYYSRSGCSYFRAGQCYDAYYSSWSKELCDEANGYFTNNANKHCFINNYYCPRVFSSKKCYFYTSSTYTCSSCRLIDGIMDSGGTCYYSGNCSESYFLASNGQCYENRTAVTTASECFAMSDGAYYDDGLCYVYIGSSCFTAYAHRSTIYSAGTCRNIGGEYVNGICYYNSSRCPDRYHSINGECYRQSQRYSHSTCRHIGGHYATSASGGTCYFDSFNCSGFIVDGRHCYMNRSANFSSATCSNIGGIYGYYSSGRRYHSAGRYRYSYRDYYCLYDTFDCAR